METEPVKRTDQDSNKLLFSDLPGYAAFLLENHLEEYTRLILAYSIEEDIPILRLFSHLSREELIALSYQPNADFLKIFIGNQVAEYIETTIKAYKEDKMEEIGREDILIEDLTLGAFVRRKTFRKLVHHYTTEFNLISSIMEEVDRFVAASEGAAFKALIEIQMERITKMNEELTATKEDLLELQELADSGSYVWNLVDDTFQFTPGVRKILGISSADSEDFISKVHPEDLPRVREAFEKAHAGNGEYETEYRYVVGGVEKYVWSRGIVVFDNGVAIRMKGTVTDITNKHQLLKELQKSEELSKQAQALTHIGNWSWEVGTDTVTWSDEMYRIYGLVPQSEQINFARFLALIHPDDRQRRMDEIHESLETLQTKDYLLRVLNPDGTIKVLRGKGEVISENGKAVKMVGTCQDITKEFSLNEEIRLKSIELEQLNTSLATKNTELERINKELESFNYVASHDLQEPLRKIQLFTNRILETSRDQLPGGTPEYFDKIIHSTTRMRLLIDDLLKFSRTSVTDLVMETVDLNQLVSDVVASVSQALEEKEMTIAIGELPVIEGIPFQLQQLFQNLLSNSLKYTRINESPKVNISAQKVAAKDIDGHHNGCGHYHEIRFADNGIGFEHQNATKIFELFQRLHGRNEYMGTGIGLAICKKIAYNHKGMITAKGYPGVGAEFYVYFPA